MKCPENETLPEIRLGRKYQAYCDARETGLTIQESVDKAEVSRPTGTKWERARVAVEIASGARSGPVTRGELETLYSKALRSAPANVVAQIGAAYQKLKGFELPQDTAALQWPQSTIAWIDEEHRRLVARQHACTQNPICPPGSPNAKSTDFIESPEQNLQKSSGSDDEAT